MDLSFLPAKILQGFNFINTDKLYEIRLRNGFPIIVKYGKENYYLTDDGVTNNKNNAIICSIDDVNEIINNLTERSIYAYVDKLKKGFLTSKDGVRVGLAGECVFEKEIVTIKNIQSLNIRVPHEIVDASKDIIKYIFDNGKILNSLIISPPFCGKTTILKDLSKKINDYGTFNVLLVDERGEFNVVKGERIDVIKYCDKSYAFDYGIRSMSPDVIITDELGELCDWDCVLRASLSGVNVIASCHAFSIDDLKRKNFFTSGVFDRYFILSSNKCNPGVLSAVYNKNFERLL